MFNYFVSRGLDSVEVLAKNFPNHIWHLPDLICDDVLEMVRRHVGRLEFYHINKDFSWAAKVNGPDPKIFYVIDYFGKEFRLGRDAPPNTITIRDSVWFPYPFSPVEYNQIWFNSLRKILWAEKGMKGSNIISPYRLSGVDERPNLYNHPALTWREINKRWENYYFCKEVFSKYAVSDHNQQFPSVFPLILKDRERILANVDVPLPGMWANKYSLPNDLYEQLAFVPLDSRFNQDKLADIATKLGS